MRISKAPMKQRTLHNLVSYLPLFNCKQPVLGTEVQSSLWLFLEIRNNEVLACILYSTFYRIFSTSTAMFTFQLTGLVTSITHGTSIYFCFLSRTKHALQHCHPSACISSTSSLVPHVPTFPAFSVFTAIFSFRYFEEIAFVGRLHASNPSIRIGDHGAMEDVCVICMVLPLYSQRTQS
jgi:hypothetical protein